MEMQLVVDARMKAGHLTLQNRRALNVTKASSIYLVQHIFLMRKFMILLFCASSIRRKCICGKLQCANGRLQMPEKLMGVKGERTERQPGRKHIERPQQISRMLQALLLRKAGIVGPRKHEMQIEAWLCLYVQRRGQKGRGEQRTEGQR
jgi:hypothetical protein